MKLSVRTSIVTLALLVSANAYASSAIVTSTIYLRVGPGTQYGAIGAIPNGVGITVAGCTSGYGWCQVTYGGMTGWAASSYIAIQTGNGYTTNDNFGSTAAAVGIPLIAGIAIGSALSANSGPYWGPGPYRGWGGGGNVYNGCIGRNCQSWRGGHNHWNPRWGVGPAWRTRPANHYWGPGPVRPRFTSGGFNGGGFNRPAFNRPAFNRGFGGFGGFGGGHFGNMRPIHSGR